MKRIATVIGSLLLASCLLATPASATETISRFNFELHCEEPLLGSRWEQPQHEVWQLLEGVEQFATDHPHEGVLSARLFTAWWSNGIGNEESYNRAFLTMVVEDEALHEAARTWLEQQPGVQLDTIIQEQADAADPFVQHPAVDFIINGSSYRYPGDFDIAERNWMEYFARTNYPNQTMFIVHPDHSVLGRFGLGELCTASTFGNGEPIVIDTIQEQFDLGDITVPAGMELYPLFLPTHLVPDSDEELHSYLLAEIRRNTESFAKGGNGGSDRWWISSYPIDMLDESSIDNSIAAARGMFDEWLAGYPLHGPDGPLFGSCTMQTVESGGRPVELLVRLQDMDTSGRWQLQRRLADVWLYPRSEYSLSSGLIGLGNVLDDISEHGLTLGHIAEMQFSREDAQAAVDAYTELRAGIHPPLDDWQATLTEENDRLLLKAQLPSQAELSRMRSWLKHRLPGHPQLMQVPGAWLAQQEQQEPVAGNVEINGVSYSYPEDFEGIPSRHLEALLNPHRTQRVLSMFEGIDYKPLDDEELNARFDFGDLAMIEMTDDGIRITTLEQNWEHGVDLDSKDLPPGFSVSLSAGLPLWFGDDPGEIREFAKMKLTGYQPTVVGTDGKVKSEVSDRTYRSIIANPIPTVRQQALLQGENSEEPTQQERQASKEATRICYDTVLEWLADNGQGKEDLSLESFSNHSSHKVTFHANEMRGFVQQIQIGVADVSEAQMIDLMDRICLATGMRDVWGRYDGNIYPTVVVADGQLASLAGSAD